MFKLTPFIKLGVKFNRDDEKKGPYLRYFLVPNCPHCLIIVRMATELISPNVYLRGPHYHPPDISSSLRTKVPWRLQFPQVASKFGILLATGGHGLRDPSRHQTLAFQSASTTPREPSALLEPSPLWKWNIWGWGLVFRSHDLLTMGTSAAWCCSPRVPQDRMGTGVLDTGHRLALERVMEFTYSGVWKTSL